MCENSKQDYYDYFIRVLSKNSQTIDILEINNNTIYWNITNFSLENL